MANEKRKQSLYFPEEMLAEIQREASRQDRSLSWLVQQAWKIAKDDIIRLPSYRDPTEAPPELLTPPAPLSEAEAFAQGKFETK